MLGLQKKTSGLQKDYKKNRRDYKKITEKSVGIIIRNRQRIGHICTSATDPTFQDTKNPGRMVKQRIRIVTTQEGVKEQVQNFQGKSN